MDALIAGLVDDAAVFPPGTVIPDAAYDLVERLAADLGHGTL